MSLDGDLYGENGINVSGRVEDLGAYVDDLNGIVELTGRARFR